MCVCVVEAVAAPAIHDVSQSGPFFVSFASQQLEARPSQQCVASGWSAFAMASKYGFHIERTAALQVLQWTPKPKLPIYRRMGDRWFSWRCRIVSDAASLLCAGAGWRGNPNQTERAGQNMTRIARDLCLLPRKTPRAQKYVYKFQ